VLYRAILSLPVMFFATYCYVPDVKLCCMSVLNLNIVCTQYTLLFYNLFDLMLNFVVAVRLHDGSN